MDGLPSPSRFNLSLLPLTKKAEILGAHHKLYPGVLREVTPGPQPFRAFSRWWEVDRKLMTPAQVTWEQASGTNKRRVSLGANPSVCLISFLATVK